MGQILTEENLEGYIKWKKKPWGVADLLYERVPMLTVRNYICTDSDHRWPLCWSEGQGLRRGLALCIDFLRSWKAFRPGSADSHRRAMEEVVPATVMGFQTRVLPFQVNGTSSVCKRGKEGRARMESLARIMTKAVVRVSAVKRLKTPTPMLGSKVMHCFFPEFFPVWDTAVLGKALHGLWRHGEVNDDRSDHDQDEDPAAREYGAYVRLMLQDLLETKGNVNQLDDLLVENAVSTYQDKFLRDLLYENLGDRSPILFELCTIGYARRKGLLA